MSDAATSSHVRRLASRVERTTARFMDEAARGGQSVADLPSMRLPWYEVRDEAGGPGGDPATVLIYDEIGGSFGVTAKDFAVALEKITAPTIHLRINSPGGSLFDAIAIYNTLHHHPARVVVYVDALAASAASLIAMGGDEIVMMPGSQLMIHDASAVEDGNAADMRAMSAFLDRQSDNVADIYRLRGGGEAGEWRELMLAETWMFAAEAVDMGLADRVEIVAPAPAPEAIEERMRRSFDLAQFRYAGRDQAPAPARRTAAQTSAPRQTRSPIAAHVVSASAAMREAAERRAEAAAAGTAVEGEQLRTLPPMGVAARRVSTAWLDRSSPLGTVRLMPPRLQVSKQERDGKPFYVVEGYATVYERGYEMWDVHGPYTEIVSRGAANKTLEAGPDVVFLVNHSGLAMARTVPAGTLELWTDEVGMGDRAWLNPGRTDVKDLVLNIEDGITTEQSFAFMIESGRWSPDFVEYRIDQFDVDRGDVSAVNYGANPHTPIGARAREILDELAYLPTGAARAALDRLRNRADLAQMTPARRTEAEPQMTAEPEPSTADARPAVVDGAGRTLLEVDAWLAQVAAR